MKTNNAIDNTQLLSQLQSGTSTYTFYSLAKLADLGFKGVERLPFSVRILLESVIRNIGKPGVTGEHAAALAAYNPKQPGSIELPFKPARVLLQDFTGVPCVVDLAAMRSAMQRLGGDPAAINPELGVDLVIDHSVQVDYFNSSEALQKNADLEFARNRERYEFLRWGQGALQNFSVVPPASGICHQVNLEYLGKVVQQSSDAKGQLAFFDSLVGTDSHTPMINGLGVVGWGVGGIEAEAAMLGQPVSMLAPAVIGVRLSGSMAPGVTATDLVLRITEMLRAHGVVGKFVEFYGDGIGSMTVPDRATLSNMAPEYGATVGYFPIDEQTLKYLFQTGRSEEQIELVEAYARAQNMFHTADTPEPDFEEVLTLDLATVRPSIAGPKRPQDRINLDEVPQVWQQTLSAPVEKRGYDVSGPALESRVPVAMPDGSSFELTHGDVAIAAITSCTNTSNPSVLLAAGLLAKKAHERGLSSRPWVKTSFAPGSMVVTEYLIRTGLMQYLEALGFFLVGYGCTTCIGNSGPLPAEIQEAVEEGNLVVAGVLSGNRNFEGRINPHTRANFLTSPPLVVAYAVAGRMDINLAKDPIGHDKDGKPVYMHEIWPSEEELAGYVSQALNREAFINSYSGLEDSNEEWNRIESPESAIYNWKEDSTYIQEPPFFQDMSPEPEPIGPIQKARVLVMAGDSITTDHISPAGAIDPDSPAGKYLQSIGVEVKDFNSYGSRRGNDRVMTRGTFANIRFRNKMAPGTEGSFTTHQPSGEVMSIFDAGQLYRKDGVPSIVLAGKDYGMGSSRDWAAKGTQLLGIRAVIAESYERIHRSNLVGMGILPLQFLPGENYTSLGLSGEESFDIELSEDVRPGQELKVTATAPDGKLSSFTTICRIDSPVEVEYYRQGGILNLVLRRFLKHSA